MKYTKVDSHYIIRIERGEELVSSLKAFCEKEEIKSAIVQGIGAVDSATLGFYHLERKEYAWKNFINPLEIVSLLGNISQVDAKPFVHLHVVLSNSEYQTHGGHLKEAIVGATCEIFLNPIEEINRVLNEEVGLKLISCENQL